MTTTVTPLHAHPSAQLRDAAHDYRHLICECCGGDGGWDVETGRGVDWATGYRQTCRECDGLGGYMQEVEPITLEDLH